MRNKLITSFKVVMVVGTLIGLMACMDQKNQVFEVNKGHTVTEHAAGEEKKVVLTASQFNALQIKVDTLIRRNMGGYVEANGQLEVPPQNEATITSVIGANVVAIEVIEGDRVRKGETVAYLSHPDIIQKQTDYLNAYSNSQFLRKAYDRQKTLYDAGVGSGANVQKAEAEYQVAHHRVGGLAAQLMQLNVDVAEVQKGNIQERIPLRSPIDGFVHGVSVKTGQFVAPQTELFEVVDTHHVHADLMVFEKDVYKVKEGQKVIFNVQSILQKELTAEIYSVGKTFEQDPKALHVHAEIENKEGNLIPGMYIEGRIQTDYSQTLAFSENAIASDGEKSYVFAVQDQGADRVFVPMEIAIGEKDGDWVAVTFFDPVEPGTKFAQNRAYYLMGEMKKGEAVHSH